MAKRLLLSGNRVNPSVVALLLLLGLLAAFKTFVAQAENEAVQENSAPSIPAKPAGDAAKAAEPDKEVTTEPRDAKAKEAAPKQESEFASIRASSVNAVYHIKWLGAYIGDFNLRSTITNRQYSLQANAEISVFFGTVSWKGVTSSRGLMTANGPMPQDYTFRYSTNGKGEAVQLHFVERMVRDIMITPPHRPGIHNVPITAAHLQNVVDPLSAVILLSQVRLGHHGHGENACDRRLPIFDGKTRYDLVFVPKGTHSIANTGKLRGTAYVCGVRYVPIAGHKPGKHGESGYMSGNSGIEVWLVPMPEAGLMVPYYISVPTPAGTASMITAKFDIETASGRRALIN